MEPNNATQQASNQDWKIPGNGLRAIVKVKKMHPVVKAIAIELIDYLNKQSGFRVAWLTYAAIAENTCYDKSTIKKYMPRVMELGLFKKVKKATLANAKLYLQSKGANPKFDRCQYYVPNIYERVDHPAWNGLKEFPKQLREEMAEISHRTPKRSETKATVNAAPSQDVLEKDAPKNKNTGPKPNATFSKQKAHRASKSKAPSRPRPSRADAPSLMADFISDVGNHTRATRASQRSELFNRNNYYDNDEVDETTLTTAFTTATHF